MHNPKIKPSDLRAEAQRLIDSGQMPSLDRLLATIAETREQYKDRILAARELAKPLQPHTKEGE